MAGKVPRIASSLLLLVSLIQGLRSLKVLDNEPLEAVEGQNISLPCVMKDVTNLNIVNIEWKKSGDVETRLGVYNPIHGHHYDWLNVTIQIEKNDVNEVLSSHLFLPGVSEWDSGMYVCEMLFFPVGFIKIRTNLTVKGKIKITCDPDDVIEVSYGEKATINCTVSSDARYRWTKDETVVSQNQSLELWRVTDVDAGVYKLTVNAGDETLHRNFTIIVLTATTSLRTDSVTESTQVPTNSTHSSFKTLQTTELSTLENWTPYLNTSDVTIPPVEDVTSSTSLMSTSIPSSPDTHSSTYHTLNLTTSSNDTTVFRTTQEMVSEETRNGSRVHTEETQDLLPVTKESSRTAENSSGYSEHPGSTQTEGIKITASNPNKKSLRRHHLIIVFIISLLSVIVVVCILKMIQIKKSRMDLPPPFKPPPPPIKYTAARHNEVSTQYFPTSRCNSIAEPRDMRQTYI